MSSNTKNEAAEPKKGPVDDTHDKLLTALEECARLLADYDTDDGEEGEAYRNAVAAITQARAQK